MKFTPTSCFCSCLECVVVVAFATVTAAAAAARTTAFQYNKNKSSAKKFLNFAILSLDRNSNSTGKEKLLRAAAVLLFLFGYFKNIHKIINLLT